MIETRELLEFWSRQLSEHAVFLELGLEPQGLKDDAARLHGEWEAFREDLSRSSDLGRLSESAIEKAGRLRAFKTEVYDRLVQGEWLGWLFPRFVLHIRRELDYFVQALRVSRATPGGGPVRAPLVDQDLCTWLGFMGDHAAFAAHLLDPKETVLILQAQALNERFLGLKDGCSSMLPDLVRLSDKAGVLLDRYFSGSGIGTEKVLSIIHPALALHVVREGRMFLNVMASRVPGRGVPVEIPE